MLKGRAYKQKSLFSNSGISKLQSVATGWTGFVSNTVYIFKYTKYQIIVFIKENTHLNILVIIEYKLT